MVPNRISPGVLAFVAVVVAGGCGSSPTAQQGFGGSPLVTVVSASGALQLAVFTNPQPPTDGNVAVRYVVTDIVTTQPVDGLSLDVVPWMPAMGHGTTVVPSVSPAGEGVYDLSNVYLYMAGQWQLRTTMSGGTSDSAAPDLMVQ
jgi:YtkA-like